MDRNLYQRIMQYAILIAGGDALPWPGLYTARSVYNLLKYCQPLYPEDIGAQLGGLSCKYVIQIILALQNGGIEIKSVPQKPSTADPELNIRSISTLKFVTKLERLSGMLPVLSKCCTAF
jgi:hypothetical protein